MADWDPSWLKDFIGVLESKTPQRYALLEHFAYAMSEFLDHVDDLLSRCESPIEKKFLEALLSTAPVHGLPIVFQPHDLAELEAGRSTWGLGISPQAPISLSKNFRADFLLITKDRHTNAARKLVIECDGHDFHERTKEQASRDKSRDRDMTAAGYSIMRFTGSEIHKDARECADQACAFMSRWR